MTDERAAVEFAPLPWKMVPWHIAEDSPHVKCAHGWIVCTASSDAMAKLIADSVNDSVALRAENTELSARVSELTRLLAEAEEGERSVVAWLFKRLKLVAPHDFEMPKRVTEAVQRALQSGEGGVA